MNCSNKTTSDIDPNTLTAEEREDLMRRLAAASTTTMQQMAQTVPWLSQKSLGTLTEQLLPTEAVPLITSLFALLIRGATVADCTRYVSTRQSELPCRGAERAILEAILTSLASRVEADEPARLVTEIASFMDGLLNSVQAQCGVSRATLANLWNLEMPRD